MKGKAVSSRLAGLVFFLFAAQAGGTQEAGTAAPDLRLAWNEPGRSSADSMPLGNGDIGLNLWVEEEGDLLFYISKTDAWSENARLLKLGRIRVQLSPNPFAKERSSPERPFMQTLHLKKGEITVDAGGTSLRIWVDANRPVIRVEAEGEAPFVVTASLETWRNERRELKGEERHSAYGLHVVPDGYRVMVEPDTVVNGLKDRVVWYHRNERSIWAGNLRLQSLEPLIDALTDPLLHRTFGACMQGPGLVSRDARTLVSKERGKRFLLSICPLTAQTDTADAWIDQLHDLADAVHAGARADSADPAEARAAHRAWWEVFWNRSWITVEGGGEAEKVTTGYALQRFINACGGRGGSPIKFNGSIFTVDVPEKGFDGDYRRWGGPYWWQNTRLPYWAMLAAGDFDLMEPLFRMYREALPLARARTKIYHGHEGVFFPETMYFWGTYTGANYGWDREGKEIGLIDNNYIKREWQGGIELAVMMLDYYDYTGDARFLRETLLPHGEATITFFDRHWPRDEGGKIRMHPAQALETWWDCTNPLPEVAGLRSLLDWMVLLPHDGVTEEQRASWAKTLHDLPEIPLGEEEGKRFMLPAETFARKSNIENPELYAVFPYGHYGVGKPDLEIGLETWRRRLQKGTGGWNQNPVQAACLGLTEEAKAMVAKNFSTHHGGSRFPAFWGPNYDWIPDQDHGGVSMVALQRMLLQTGRGGEILLLPAWPGEWDVDFKLHAPFKTTVECTVRNGEIAKLRVTPPERGKDVRILDRDR